jgi:ADP-ribose 1''-phosphate phosphatase
MSASTSQPTGVTVHEGDLFASAPQRCILVHACNTLGSWGSGIAAAFKTHYPEAYQVYNETCIEKGDDLLGTCLLIPTGERDIACLFTSRRFGRAVDPPKMILQSTRSAVEDLQRQIKEELLDKPIYGW